MRHTLPALLALAACARDFTLPAKPQSQPPAIASFDPAHAHTGARITVTGANLGTRLEDVEVRFGRSAAVRPLAVAADGISLEARVPEDATKGAISVTTAAGRGTSTAEFIFDGAGYLRRGQVVAEVDLSPQVEAAFLDYSGQVVMQEDQTFGRTLSVDRNGDAVDLGLPIVAMTPGPDGAVAVLDLFCDPEAEECTDDFRGNFRLFSASSQGEPIALNASGCGPNACYAKFVAVNGDATFAVVSGRETIWVVDVDAETATRIATDRPLYQVAWAGENRFLFVDSAPAGGLRALTRDDNTGAWTLAAGFEVFTERSATAIAATPSGFAALGSDDGNVALLATAAAPFTIAQRIDTGSSSWITSVALSPDGERLVVTQSDANRAVIYNIEPDPPVALAAHTLNAPAQAHGSSAGFHVAHRGGATVLGKATGAVVGRVPLLADLRSPRLRTASEGASAVQVLEVASRTFGVALRLDPRNLGQRRDGILWLDAANELEEFAALPGGPDLYARRGYSTRRLEEGSLGDDAFLLGDSYNYLPPMQLSPDGQALAIAWVPNGVTRFVVLDTAATWADGATALEVDGEFTGMGFAGDRFILATRDAVHVLDRAAAMRGEEVDAVPPIQPDGVVLAAGVGAELVLGLYAPALDDFSAHFLFVASPVDGSILGTAEVPSLDYDTNYDARFTFRVAPGGRRLWWLSGEDEARKLVSVVVDPERGAFEDLELPVALPAGASEFYVYPDGERIVVVDNARDRLLLLR